LTEIVIDPWVVADIGILCVAVLILFVLILRDLVR